MMASHIMSHFVPEGNVPDGTSAVRDSEAVARIPRRAAHQIPNSAHADGLADLGHQVGVVGVSQSLDSRVSSQITQVRTRARRFCVEEFLRMHKPDAHSDLAVYVRSIRCIDRGLGMSLSLCVAAEYVLCCSRINYKNVNAVTRIRSRPGINIRRLR